MIDAYLDGLSPEQIKKIADCLEVGDEDGEFEDLAQRLHELARRRAAPATGAG